MLTAQDILLGVLAPALLAGALALWTGRRLGCGLALAAGYGLGQWAVAGRPEIPPHTAEQWLPFLAFLALAAEAALVRWKKAAVQWPLGILLTAALAAATCQPLIRHSWSYGETAFYGLAILAAALSVWKTQGAWLARYSGKTALIAWAMWAGAAGLACAMSGSQMLGQLGGALAAVLAGCAAAAFWAPQTGLQKGGLFIAVILWIGILINGYFYAELPGWALSLFLLSVAALWVRPFLATTALRQWHAEGLTLLAAALPLAAALTPIAIQFVRSMSQDAGDPYYGY